MLSYPKTIVRPLLERMLRRRGPCLASPGRILVVAVGFLGDIVIIQPFLHALRRGFPDATISLMVEKESEPLLRENQNADQFIYYDRDRARDPFYLLSFILKVRREKYDLAVVHYGHFHLEDILFTMCIEFIIGYDSDLGFERSFTYDLLSRKVPKDWSRNEIENSFKLLEATGIRAQPDKGSLRIPMSGESVLRAAGRYLPAGPRGARNIIMMHIGAGYQTKKWPPARWARAGDILADKLPATLFITGSAGDVPEQEEILSLMKNTASGLCGETSLEDLIALLRRSDLLISTDSGPKHFAYALGVPTVEIYGPSRSWRWGAYWDKEIHVAMDKKDSNMNVVDFYNSGLNGSLIEDDRYDGIIQQVSAEEVAEAALGLLARRDRPA